MNRYVFEVSWEVCNMVGGIHTVLSTKAPHAVARYGDGYITVGPDLPRSGPSSAVFREEAWMPEALERFRALPVSVRMGRWQIPGEPRCLLVNNVGLYPRKDAILSDYWERFHVDSLFGAWDYYDPLLFAHASGLVIESFYRAFVFPHAGSCVVHAHEWMSGAAILHLSSSVPSIGTVFTTHATVLGRALASHSPDVDIYQTLEHIDPSLAAGENNVRAKHSMESVVARECDVLTTVSDITASECAALLGRAPDMLLPNGLGARDVTEQARASGREKLFAIGRLVTGDDYDRATTRIVLSAGRYEYVNKGLDVAIDAVNHIRSSLGASDFRALVFLAFPGGHVGPTRALLDGLHLGRAPDGKIRTVTHDLRDPAQDPIQQHLGRLGWTNEPGASVHVVQLPIYLDGTDPLLPYRYGDLLVGADVTVFPSLYEPWGYTPLESISVGIPTITSDLAGFGLWARSLGDASETGVRVVQRSGRSHEQAVVETSEMLLTWLTLDTVARQDASEAATATAALTSWSKFERRYAEAHDRAAARGRAHISEMPWRRFASLAERDVVATTVEGHDVTALKRRFTVVNSPPTQLEPLRALAENLWWTSVPEAVALFREIDPALFDATRGNAAGLLEEIPVARLRALANDPAFIERMTRLHARFSEETSDVGKPTVAYFCMEYALAAFAPMYSGGLGVLAGDHLRAASDAGVPLCAIGLAYSRGYFRQAVDRHGWQHTSPEDADFRALPFEPVLRPDGTRLMITVPFPSGTVHVQAYRVNVGRTALYLLDTDHAANEPRQRAITRELYGGGLVGRIEQELVLAHGGYSLLGALDLLPDVFHLNEGHSAFLALVRMAHLVTDRGLTRREASQLVQHTTIFTSHTSVPAGLDRFPDDLARPYLAIFQDALKLDLDALLALGRTPLDTANDFGTMALAVRSANRVNAVSVRHREVTQHVLRGFFPGFAEDEIPVSAITNGVHVGTWLAPEWQALFGERLGPGWRAGRLDEEECAFLRDLDPVEAFAVRQKLRERLHAFLRAHVRATYARRGESTALIARVERALTSPRCVIGFARRFVSYKRPFLLFDDLDRLGAVLRAEPGAVLAFAGKAHPADTEGQRLIGQVLAASREPVLDGRVIFLEGYDLDVARVLVAGCDVWLNTPLRPLEACGTSGMKAAMNGCIHLSVGDGWWLEGFTPESGFLIGGNAPDGATDDAEQDAYDRAEILRVLESEVLPMAGATDEHGVPVAFVRKSLAAMARTIPRFGAGRMLREYDESLYVPARKDAQALSARGYAPLHALTEYRERLRAGFSMLQFEDVEVKGLENDCVSIGVPLHVSVTVRHPGLESADLEVQAVVEHLHIRSRDEKTSFRVPLVCEHGFERSVFTGQIVPDSAGAHRLGFRVVPREKSFEGVTMKLHRVAWL